MSFCVHERDSDLLPVGIYSMELLANSVLVSTTSNLTMKLLQVKKEEEHARLLHSNSQGRANGPIPGSATTSVSLSPPPSGDHTCAGMAAAVGGGGGGEASAGSPGPAPLPQVGSRYFCCAWSGGCCCWLCLVVWAAVVGPTVVAGRLVLPLRLLGPFP